MDIRKINKGLVVYNRCFGLMIVDKVLDDGTVVCDNCNITIHAHLLEEVDREMLEGRYITQKDLDEHGAHI